MEIFSNILTFILSLGLWFGLLFIGAFLVVISIMIAGILKDKSHKGTGSARDLANQAERDSYKKK